MKALRRAGVSAAWLAVFGISGVALAAPDRLSSEIDSGSTVRLQGVRHPLARLAADLGRVDPATRINNLTIEFSRSPQQQAELENLLAEQHRSGSPLWHQWLTPEQFGERFGVSHGDLQRVQRWLESRGLEVVRIPASRNQIAVAGSVGSIEQAFGVQLHRYRYDGETHFASAGEPRLPAALAGMVLGLRHLDDFHLKPLGITSRQAGSGVASPGFTTGGKHQLVPADIATIYDIQPLYNQNIDGTGITIAVLGRAVVDMADIEAFRLDARLPTNDPVVLPVPGTEGSSGGVTNPDDVIESDLDLEWSGAVAYGASISYVTTSGADGFDVTDSLTYAIQSDLAPIISMSYGTCEPQVSSADIKAFTALGQQANAQGQTIIASSGDSGAAACDLQGVSSSAKAAGGIAVNFPADLAEVTGVGGTEFSGDVDSPATYWSAFNGLDGGSAKKYIPETSWNDTGNGLAASGGGVSTLVTKPGWQGGTGVPDDGQRDVPDIAFTASLSHDPYLICANTICAGGGFSSDTELPIGGTSASAPVFAGMLALLEQSSGSTGVGNVNLLLYTLATSSTTYSKVFHDITTGSNVVPCVSGSTDCTGSTTSFGYDAGVGYDTVTGLGSIDVNAMAAVFTGVPLTPTTSALVINPNRVQVGKWVTLTATVTPQTQGSDALLGSVQFALDGTAIGAPVTLVNQKATLKITIQDLGIHTIGATYSGDSSYALSHVSNTVSVLALPPSQDSKDGGGGALPPLMLGVLAAMAGWRRRRAL